MKYLTILLLMVLSSVSMLAQQDKSLCPLGSTLTIDGKGDDWPMAWVQDDDKIFSFNVCTDAPAPNLSPTSFIAGSSTVLSTMTGS